MNPYHIIYSLFYSLSKKMNGEDNAPIYNASLGMSAIISINVGTVVLLVNLIFWGNLSVKINDIPIHFIVLCSLLFFCINYIYFKVRKISIFEGAYFFGRYVTAATLATIYAAVSVLLLCVMMFLAVSM